jgi:hypothetical protein
MPNFVVPWTTLLSLNSKHQFQDEIMKPRMTKNGFMASSWTKKLHQQKDQRRKFHTEGLAYKNVTIQWYYSRTPLLFFPTICNIFSGSFNVLIFIMHCLPWFYFSKISNFLWFTSLEHFYGGRNCKWYSFQADILKNCDEQRKVILYYSTFSCLTFHNEVGIINIKYANLQFILYIPEDKIVMTFLSDKLCKLFMCFHMFFVCINHFPHFTPFLLSPFKSVKDGSCCT